MSRDSEDIHAALAALADGTLSEQRRAPLLAQVADSPELAAELEDQRRAVAIVGSLEGVRAPTLLRRSIETAASGDAVLPSPPDAPASGRVRAGARRRALRRAPRLAAAAALAAAVVVAVALVLLVPGGSSNAPTVHEVSSVGLRGATRPAPAESPHNPHLLDASAAGISYPYWGAKLGWQAVGARIDTVGGRTVTTVFYTDRHARRIGYSIVSGATLPIPTGSAVVERRGVSFHVLSPAHPTVIVWREAGHTCMLTAREVDTATLVRLATWERAA